MLLRPALIDHLQNQPEASALIERLAEAGIAISIISYMEVYQGVLRSPVRQHSEASFGTFLVAAPILPFSPAVARRCAELRERLRQQGKRVRGRALDLMVAATALEHGLTLVTRNIDDYDDIPGLTLYR
ncbi:MAG TPA: type II toxin-antitoxin system VapC family toxin [Thermomicrobiaceae bacterium]|nr:type II toxin-antitoxin system VapC family toxin [Thermomicrobiaceae bacterium]